MDVPDDRLMDGCNGATGRETTAARWRYELLHDEWELWATFNISHARPRCLCRTKGTTTPGQSVAYKHRCSMLPPATHGGSILTCSQLLMAVVRRWAQQRRQQVRHSFLPPILLLIYKPYAADHYLLYAFNILRPCTAPLAPLNVIRLQCARNCVISSFTRMSMFRKEL